MKEINWDSEKADERLIAATVERSTIMVEKRMMVIIFNGTDAETRKPYEGRINLELHLNEQEAAGTYSTEGREVPFAVKGRFADTDFTLFEGKWHEPQWSAYFCIV